jgi:hypothetical protein
VGALAVASALADAPTLSEDEIAIIQTVAVDFTDLLKEPNNENPFMLIASLSETFVGPQSRELYLKATAEEIRPLVRDELFRAFVARNVQRIAIDGLTRSSAYRVVQLSEGDAWCLDPHAATCANFFLPGISADGTEAFVQFQYSKPGLHLYVASYVLLKDKGGWTIQSFTIQPW